MHAHRSVFREGIHSPLPLRKVCVVVTLARCRFVLLFPDTKRDGLPSRGRIAFHLDMHHQPTTSIGLCIVVGGVMRNVAMDHPFAGLARFPDHVVALAGADVDGIVLEAAAGGVVPRRRAPPLRTVHHGYASDG